MATEIEIGTQRSCVILPNMVSMRVRGGGIGGDAWIARVTGTHPKYKIDREFVRADRSGLSGSGKSGTIVWSLEEDGIYEYRNLCSSSSDTSSGFFHRESGEVFEMTREEVLAAIAE